MTICASCLKEMIPLDTYVEHNMMWQENEPSFIICCDKPWPIEIEDGELESYEENYRNLDLTDLTEKEETILAYLVKEGRIGKEDDKQIEFNF